MKIYFDGGLRPLPAGMEIATVVGGRAQITRSLGPGTSMEAEWLALIAAARLAITLEASAPILLGDCLPVIQQATGRTRTPPVHRPHLLTLQSLLPLGGRLRHVKRTQNLAGIALEKGSFTAWWSTATSPRSDQDRSGAWLDCSRTAASSRDTRP